MTYDRKFFSVENNEQNAVVAFSAIVPQYEELKVGKPAPKTGSRSYFMLGQLLNIVSIVRFRAREHGSKSRKEKPLVHFWRGKSMQNRRGCIR
jgi:hypothetical protein